MIRGIPYGIYSSIVDEPVSSSSSSSLSSSSSSSSMSSSSSSGAAPSGCQQECSTLAIDGIGFSYLTVDEAPSCSYEGDFAVNGVIESAWVAEVGTAGWFATFYNGAATGTYYLDSCFFGDCPESIEFIFTHPRVA